jgi:hypothetical protein
MVFPYLKDAIKEYGVFFLFAGLSLAGTIFGLFFVKDPPKQTEPKSQYDELVSRPDQ